MGYLSRKDRVKDYLDKITPREVTAKQISYATGIVYATVRTNLRRLILDKAIFQASKGLYRSNNFDIESSASVVKEIKLHGLKFELRVKSESIWWQGLTPPRTMDVSLHKHPVNGGVTWEEWFESRWKLSLTSQRKAGLIEAYLQCSKDPLKFSDFRRFLAFLEGRFTPIPVEKWDVRQFGLAHDTPFWEWRGGPGFVGLRAVENSWLNIYQKGDLLRIETHGTLKVSPAVFVHSLADAIESLQSRIFKGAEGVKP